MDLANDGVGYTRALPTVSTSILNALVRNSPFSFLLSLTIFLLLHSNVLLNCEVELTFTTIDRRRLVFKNWEEILLNPL